MISFLLASCYRKVEYTVTIGPSTAISACPSLTKHIVTANVVIDGINPKTTSVSTQTPSKTQLLSKVDSYRISNGIFSTSYLWCEICKSG